MFSSLSFSQNSSFCGSDEANQIYLQQHPQYKILLNNFEKYWKKNQQSLIKSKQNMTYYVPVVFHILHNNGPENIPDSLIYQEIDIMNECFRKMPGTPGDGDGVDTKIEFCLATIDPDGNSTTGITHTQTPCTDMNYPGCSNLPGSIIAWGDSLRYYLNIWVVKSITGGYKGLGGPGIQVIMRYDCVGRNSINQGKIIIHEIGHCFNLMHTFNDGCGSSDCSSSGDMICDTPPVAFPNHGCPVGQNSCTNDIPDLPDQVKNYMDYSTCMNMFTEGQKARMHAFINYHSYYSKLVSEENLYLTGACYPCTIPPCPPFAHFKADKTFAYMEDSICFTDISYNTPTSWQWSFPGGTPSVSTLQNPVVIYNNYGFYDVTLIVSNAAGSDTIIMNNYITIGNPQVSSIGGGLNGGVHDLIVYNNELYAGGGFTTAGGVSANRVAKWDGTNWHNLGTGVERVVVSFEIFNGELYAAADLYIYKWDGMNWSIIDSLSGGGWTWFNYIKVYNGELYIAKDSIVVKWDGTNMTTVGITSYTDYNDVTTGGEVYWLEVYNNELYAGGSFDSINGIGVDMVAKYDGTNWYPAGTEVDTTDNYRVVYVMQVYNNELYIGGFFSGVGGIPNANTIAKWNGTNWSSVGSTVDVFDSTSWGLGGMGVWNNELYVSGNFTGYIAKWNGNIWMPVEPGINEWANDFEIYNNELYAGGAFTHAGGILVNYITKWGCVSYFTQSADTVNLGVSGDVYFTDHSTNATGWYWDFGDGATDTLQNPVHTYWNEGTYTVTLVATNGTCSNEATSTVVVKYNCYPLVVNFDQNKDTVHLSISDTVSFYSWTFFYDSLLWNFGDGITDTIQNPIHTYDSICVYTVSLTAYKDTCSNTAFSTVFVCDTLFSDFTQSADTIFTGDTLHLTNNSTNASGWRWDFGDGNIDSTTFSPSHVYDSAGTYTIQLISVNPCFADTINFVIVVELAIGIEITEKEQGYFNLYPNPNDGNMQVDYKIPENKTGILEIYDVLGRKLLNYSLSSGKNTFVISGSILNKGIYFYQATAGNKWISIGKIIVIK
jgi:PKD repeat protein